ncbi:MAG TPA: M48 family metalloprotease [Gammaproteobacteria bacterium]
MAGTVNVQAATGELPDMGDASATSLTPEQEARIGKQMMRSLRRANLVNDDAELNQYIQSLGYRLAATSGDVRQPFTFFIVNDPAINAFAMPGGYIGINAGLIVASESENELASVMAHEISHITQRHLARGYEKASSMNLPMTAAVIAAIILGAHDPQAGQAALAASIAGSQQMQLDFTRANEHEADRVGIQLLAQAGFDPRGMAAFFQRLQKEMRYYGNGLPEFLSTHPVTTTRIAEAEDRASHYPPVNLHNSDSYYTTRAQLRVLLSHDVNELTPKIRDNIEKGRYGNLSEERFALALALQATGKYPEARTLLQSLLKQSPGRIAYLHALAQTEIRAGKIKEALELYHGALDLYPGNIELTLSYAAALLQANQPGKAAEQMLAFTRTHPQMAQGFRLLAQAQSALGNEAASHEAYAEHYALHDEYHSAIDQLNLARLVKGSDFYQMSRIEARLTQLQQLEQQQKLDAME